MESPNMAKAASNSGMDNIFGLLRIRVKKGVNLAIRDVRSSDPYVVIKMGKQKLKTRFIKKNVNPEWNEDLTLSVSDPKLPIFLTDHDTFSPDDKMGDAEFDIRPFLEVLKMKLEGIPDGTIITRMHPSRSNCLSEDSSFIRMNGRVVQDMFLRLRNVECGEVEIQLQWTDIPSSRDF